MSQKEKPKRKNLSPDELLQEATLLYPENEAFVRGDSKELHPKMTIFANIRAKKYGFGIGLASFKILKPQKADNAGMVLMLIGLFLFGACSVFFIGWMQFFSDTGDVVIKTVNIVCLSLLGIVFLLVGFAGVINLWKILNFRQENLQDDYKTLVQQGKLYVAKVIDLHFNMTSNLDMHNTIGISFYSTTQRRIYWHINKAHSLHKGDKVIVLYVDDKLCIVL